MALKRSYRIAAIVAAALTVIVAVSVVYQRRQAGTTAVQAGTVARQALVSIVTASGEIRPRKYVNINSQSFGKIVEIYVKEGDHVRRGQVLLRQESVQPGANLEATRALVQASQAAVEASDAARNTSQAELARAKADFQRVLLDYERSQGLHVEQLISQRDFDAAKAAFETSKASVALAEARIRQADAELNRSRSNLAQSQASLKRVADELAKTTYSSPIDGVVTNLPVEVGEQMVTGIQNSPGSFLMTVADMSEVTAEVKVDETDIVRLRLGQEVEVKIDAYSERPFIGRVTEIGTTAIVRSTGQSTAQLQTGTQEAKDFKLVVTLLDPPEEIRPGLSATARITTATRDDAIAIPIQALTIRRKSDIEAAERRDRGEEVAEAASLTASDPGNKEEIQGVFVIEDDKASFRPVETGITGVTDIEVVSGLEPGEQIITGSFSVLRELKHLAPVRIEKPGERKKD